MGLLGRVGVRDCCRGVQTSRLLRHASWQSKAAEQRMGKRAASQPCSHLRPSSSLSPTGSHQAASACQPHLPEPTLNSLPLVRWPSLST